MKCYINDEIVDCKVVENLGYQGGRYGKVVLYEGEGRIVVKEGNRWVLNTPTILPIGTYTGQQLDIGDK